MFPSLRSLMVMEVKIKIIHIGKEVAAYVEKHFIEELKKNKNFQAQNFEAALGEVFLKMDEIMVTPQGQKEVISLKGDSN